MVFMTTYFKYNDIMREKVIQRSVYLMDMIDLFDIFFV